MTLKEKLFSFRGRITRKDYWLCALAVCAVYLILFVLLLTGAAWTAEIDSGLGHGLSVLTIILALTSLWPTLAIGVKRCHDRDKSGWWMAFWLILGNVPVVGILISLWCIVELGFVDGTQGPNRFGPSPKGLGADRIADAFA